jgi:arabinose-5-phosphate isomerase
VALGSTSKRPGAAADRSNSQAIDSALRTIATERQGLDALKNALSGDLADAFNRAAGAIASARGRVVVSGVGKSGHIGRKIAATLASTGTPAFFVHASEASHGDLGMVAAEDVILALSWSGETTELRSLLEYSRRFDITLIAVTATPDSTLARQADVALVLPRADEACPHGLAPTTSTLMQLAIGDALAIALLEGRGFTAEKFHVFHPGGRLGASLKRVADIMHRPPSVPLMRRGSTMSDAIVLMSEKRFGCVGIVDDRGVLVGIITDGDLRRHIGPELLSRSVDDVMTGAPKTIAPDMLVGAALDFLNHAKITVVFIVEDGKPTGIVHMHDFLAVGVA